MNTKHTGIDRDFQKELSSLLNTHSCDNDTNTPDFLLASFLDAVLAVFSSVMEQRDEWQGMEPKPASVKEPQPQGEEPVFKWEATMGSNPGDKVKMTKESWRQINQYIEHLSADRARLDALMDWLNRTHHTLGFYRWTRKEVDKIVKDERSGEPPS
jgi:hypothetical protein